MILKIVYLYILYIFLVGVYSSIYVFAYVLAYLEPAVNKNIIIIIMITREGGKFTTSLYRKITFSGVYTNFKSFILSEYKHGLIFTLLYRAFKISSNFEIFHQEICTLKNILLKTSYPLHLNDKSIIKYLNKMYTPKEESKISETVTKCLVFLYHFFEKLLFR